MARVAVIGLGVVGSAQVRLFGDMVHATYDPALKKPYPRKRIGACDFAVICVGTPQAADGTADLSYLDAAIAKLPSSLPVLIRSTVPPGTTDRIAKDRLAAHVPEFMQERPDGAWRESGKVPFAILGGTHEAHQFFGPVLEQVRGYRRNDIYLCTGLESELVKYTANCWLAAKVTFANEMARICAAAGADWEGVRGGWLRDPRAEADHTKIEGPGFGGRCLPKDLSALIRASSNAGYEPGFLQAVQDANERFRAGVR